MITRPFCHRLDRLLHLAAIGCAIATLAGLASPSDVLGQRMGITKINVTSLPSQNRKLSLVRSFPSDADEAQGIVLSRAQFISSDSKGRIYVSDAP